jgi:NADPH:quinone reductase-like Zn-dependent oxidoreductase
VKSYHINLGAGIGGLTLKEHPEPRPGQRDVLVRVRAVSLNYRELMIAVHGWYPLPAKPDVVAVSDGAGEVVAIGEEVTRVRLGDRVVASMFPHWIDGALGLETAAQLGGSLDGMLTEFGSAVPTVDSFTRLDRIENCVPATVRHPAPERTWPAVDSDCKRG